ncbi:PspC domain-containing protein [Vallitalea maricola]|uniref:Uncharacterized protein n=1 Tax=Vallitalea maricola TaxID=3074433 RepID=A0ACB5UHD7_9FIRM|nr:hypothetical protein AN2V17_15140 [Vallitalea sp. AN17-2]
MDKRIYRSRDNQMICGVCSGIAKYFNIDPTIVRILFLITLFTWGSGVLIYIICSIVIPVEPIEYAHNTYDSNTHDNNAYYDSNTYENNTPEKRNNFSNSNGRTILGIILVIIGGVSILEKIFNWFSFDLVWPIAIIGVGFLILTKDRN